MQVATFMTRGPITVEASAKLRAALETMDEYRLRHLPVMAGDHVVGVISDRDLLEATGGVAPADSASLDGTRVEEIMQAPPVVAHPDDSVVTISVEVVLRGIGCLPVVEGGALIGIVTELDLLRLFVQTSTENQLSGDVDPPVREHMSTQVVTVGAADSVAEAIATRDSIDIRHLPVVQEGRLVGMVSDRDLRRARGQGLGAEASVEEIMVSDVQTLTPSDQLSRAAAIMSERKISALPIVEDGALVGIVTTTDLLDHCMNTLRASG